MWNTFFCNLSPLDRIQFGLCNREATVTFWRNSKPWYTPDVFDNSTIPKNRIIRKLRINLSAIAWAGTESSLDHLTHLDVADTDNAEYVKSLVLPPNLTYCFLEPSNCLTQCTLPNSLTFLETHESCLEFVNLNNHLNLTVLRILRHNRCLSALPPNLTELELAGTNHVFTSFPNSLTRLHFRNCNLENIRIVKPCETVRELTVNVIGNTEHVDSALFPAVHDLTIVYHGTCDQTVPVFNAVRNLCLHLINPLLIDLNAWKSLQSLELIVDGMSVHKLPVSVLLPQSLSSFKMTNRSTNRLHVLVPPLLTYARLAAYQPRFDLTFSANTRLRTLRTYGNVFAKKITFPESLRSFHVQLGEDETLVESWAPLSKQVNFQVFHQ